MRERLIIANFKMNMVRRSDIVAYCNTLRAHIDSVPDVKRGVTLVLCPSAPHYDVVARLSHTDARIACGAQDVACHMRGAHTGQVSPLTLADAGVRYVLVGHSEQRRDDHKRMADVAAQVAVALRADITPVIFIGETAQEHAQGKMRASLAAQFDAVTAALDARDAQRCVWVYEPVWAVGAQQPPAAEDVMAARILLQKLLTMRYDAATAHAARILYGGSVTPETVGRFTRDVGIDGVVVGRKALVPRAFLQIAATFAHHNAHGMMEKTT